MTISCRRSTRSSPQTNYCIFYIKILNTHNFLKLSLVQSVPNRLHSAKQEDESSPHPPYSPDLAPSAFHLFELLKDTLWECHFADNNKLKHSCNTIAKSFMWTAVRTSHKGGKSVLLMKKTVCTNNMNSVVDVTHDIRRLYSNCNHN
jgi:hypothetical protein